MKELRVKLENDLYDAFKNFAKDSGKSMTQIITEYVSSVSEFTDVSFPKKFILHGTEYRSFMGTATQWQYMAEEIWKAKYDFVNLIDGNKFTYYDREKKIEYIIGEYDYKKRKAISYDTEDFVFINRNLEW